MELEVQDIDESVKDKGRKNGSGLEKTFRLRCRSDTHEERKGRKERRLDMRRKFLARLMGTLRVESPALDRNDGALGTPLWPSLLRRAWGESHSDLKWAATGICQLTTLRSFCEGRYERFAPIAATQNYLLQKLS